MKNIYLVPFILLFAGCTSTEPPAPRLTEAVNPAPAPPKPQLAATPITIQSNETPPPPMNQPIENRSAGELEYSEPTLKPSRLRPLTKRGPLTEREFRYINHMVSIQSILDNFSSQGITITDNLVTDQSMAAYTKAYRMHRRFGAPPTSFANSHKKFDRGIKLMMACFASGKQAKASPEGSDARRLYFSKWKDEFLEGTELMFYGMEAVVRQRQNLPD